MMEPEKEDNDVANRSSGALLPHEAKEIQAAADYASKHEETLNKLTEEVDGYGRLRLFWDAKVPRKDWRFYHCFTFKSSNKKEVKAEIKKYLDFYKEMNAIAQKISAGEGQSEEERANAYALTLDLHQSLKELYKAAEADEKTTGSSTVYRLHREFVSKHEKLEYMIKRVECVALTKSWKRANEGLQQSLTAIDGLKKDLEASEARCASICDRFEKLLDKNDELQREQEALEEVNDLLQQQQQELLEERDETEEQKQKLMRENEELKDEKRELLQEKKKLEDNQVILKSENALIMNIFKTFAVESDKK